MAEITVAESAGFCFGVDRAVKLCYQALEEHHSIATLGPIIHNQDVVDDLTRRGARIVDKISDLHPDECVVIRSHGVSASVYDELEQAGNPYVDATWAPAVNGIWHGKRAVCICCRRSVHDSYIVSSKIRLWKST